jgi:hypothetical protein
MSRDDQRPDGSEEFGFDRLGELPYGFDTTTGTRRPGTIRPDLSWLIVRVDPTARTELFLFYMLGFREELMHGERGRFGLTRNVRLLRRQCYELFYRMLDGEVDPAVARSRIRERWDAAAAVRAERHDMLETIDQFLTRSAVRDPGLLEEQATQVTDDPTLRGDLIGYFNEQLADYEDDVPLDGVFEELIAVEDAHGTNAAVAVADTALDIPNLIAPLDPETIAGLSADEYRGDIVPPADIELVDRFERTRDALDELGPEVAGLDTQTIVDMLESELDEGTTDTRRMLQHVEMPLLDVPATIARDADASSPVEDLDAAPSMLSQVLTRAFTSVGAIGGALYRTNAGDDAWEWLVNPLIADRPVDGYPDDFPDGDDGLTYGEYWQLNLLADVFIERLMRADDPTRLRAANDCPLCRHSTDRFCGDDRCQTRPLREDVASVAPAFVVDD